MDLNLMRIARIVSYFKYFFQNFIRMLNGQYIKDNFFNNNMNPMYIYIPKSPVISGSNSPIPKEWPSLSHRNVRKYCVLLFIQTSCGGSGCTPPGNLGDQGSSMVTFLFNNTIKTCVKERIPKRKRI